ncbi:MAG: hypothetical protein R3D71_08970 [Rickettsiales bacterium]
MATVYETQKDYEQNKLKEQASKLNYKAESQFSTGAVSGLVGVAVDNYNLRKASPSTGLSWAASILNIVGIIQVVRSFLTRNRAHDLSLERERMGPHSYIKLDRGGHTFNVEDPALATNLSLKNKDSDCKGCDKKEFADNSLKKGDIKSKTLSEHAEKSGEMAIG